MTSTLKADKIEGVNASGTVRMPAGHVIQIVFLHSTTRTAITSSTYTNCSLVKAITPKFSNSLIYIQISSGYNTEASGRRIDVTIEITATGLTTEFLHELEGLATNTGRMQSMVHHGNRMEGTFVLPYVDQPNTTNEVTYQMKARENTAGSTIEIPSSNDQVQCMVLQEIKQ